MGIESYKWGWHVVDLQPMTKLVLMSLCKFAKDCGCCYPKTKAISELTGLAQRTVQQHIKYLTDIGHVKRTKRGGGRKFSGFSLNLINDGFGVACSVSGCGAKTHRGTSSISISKDIDTKNYNKELKPTEIKVGHNFIVPEWLKVVDLTTEVSLVQNANLPTVKDYISDIEKDFANIDLISEAKKYSLWWEGKKAKKPKLAFRNWLEKASKHNAKPIQRISTGSTTPVTNTISERTRQIAEQQEKLRE